MSNCEQRDNFEKVGLKHIDSLKADKAIYEFEFSKLYDQMIDNSELKFEESKGSIQDGLVPSSPISEEKSHLPSEHLQISANALQKQENSRMRNIGEDSSGKPLDLPYSQANEECYSEFEYENLSEENKEEEKSLDGSFLGFESYQTDYNSSQDDIEVLNSSEYLKDVDKLSNYCSSDNSNKGSAHLLALRSNEDFQVYELPWN